MFDDCSQVLKDFFFYMLTIKGRSIKTVEGYYIDIRGFIKYEKYKKGLTQKNENQINEIEINDVNIEFLKTITLSDVYDYLNYELTEKNNNAKTRSRKVSSLRSFFKYLTVTTHLMENNPVKDLEIPTIKKSLPKYLTLDESIDLLKSANNLGSSRDYCILVLFLNCGMRLSELVGINLQDINDNKLRILGKGNKERIVYLNESCINAINAYKNDEERQSIKPKPGNENALFLSKFGVRISGRRVEQIVDEYLKNIGLDNKGFSPHKLRHTAATLLYQQGNVDVRLLQELLGHSSLSTTEIYTHVSNKQLEEVASKSPLNKFDKNKDEDEKDEDEKEKSNISE